jgi:hypothetical protein
MFPSHEISQFEVQIHTNSFSCQQDRAARGTARQIVEIDGHFELAASSGKTINTESQAAKFCK